MKDFKTIYREKKILLKIYMIVFLILESNPIASEALKLLADNTNILTVILSITIYLYVQSLLVYLATCLLLWVIKYFWSMSSRWTYSIN